MSDETEKLALDELTAVQAPSADCPDDPAGMPHGPAAARQGDLGAVYDIPVQLSAVLGKTTMPVSQLLRLGRGAVVELDRKVGEAIDILVNNRLVARGEVVIVDDRLGVTMTEIIKTDA
jgi:flagellar motor switch protein FliN/FliY